MPKLPTIIRKILGFLINLLGDKRSVYNSGHEISMALNSYFSGETGKIING